MAQIEAGDFGDPRAHLRRDHHPVPPELTRYGRLVEFWSAISVSLVLLLIVGLTVTSRLTWWASLGIGIVLYIVIEAAFRQRLTLLYLRATLVLATIGVLILAYQFATLIVIVAIVGLAPLTLADNVREVRRS